MRKYWKTTYKQLLQNASWQLENRFCCPTHCWWFLRIYLSIDVDDWSAECVVIVSNPNPKRNFCDWMLFLYEQNCLARISRKTRTKKLHYSMLSILVSFLWNLNEFVKLIKAKLSQNFKPIRFNVLPGHSA